MRPVALRIRLVLVKRLIIFIALSFWVQLLSMAGLFTLADLVIRGQRIEPATEVELVETNPPTEKTKPIIKQLDPIDPLEKNDSRARFDSEKTQRVAQETQTRNTGLTRNASQRSIQNQAQTAEKPPQQSSDDELPEFTRMNYSNPNQDRSNQTAALSQVLPNDIHFSNATNLNTDANTYYSFYSRVEELFYVRWGERLNYYWDRLNYDFKKNQLAGKVWSTTLEVLLDATGEYRSAQIFQSSGYKPFDEAAVFAFKDARFFPNPPKAKVEQDGFVRLRYRLSVQVGNLP